MSIFVGQRKHSLINFVINFIFIIIRCCVGPYTPVVCPLPPEATEPFEKWGVKLNRGSGGRKSPSGVQGQSPGTGSDRLGDEVPQKLMYFFINKH